MNLGKYILLRWKSDLVLFLNRRDESVCCRVGWKRATMAFYLKSTFAEAKAVLPV